MNRFGPETNIRFGCQNVRSAAERGCQRDKVSLIAKSVERALVMGTICAGS
jgi:hypothetical protein